MSLFSQWNDITQMERSPKEHKAFWDEYFDIETGIYKKILPGKTTFMMTSFRPWRKSLKLRTLCLPVLWME